jgi:hypothetical protein
MDSWLAEEPPLEKIGISSTAAGIITVVAAVICYLSGKDLAGKRRPAAACGCSAGAASSPG